MLINMLSEVKIGDNPLLEYLSREFLENIGTIVFMKTRQMKLRTFANHYLRLIFSTILMTKN